MTNELDRSREGFERRTHKTTLFFAACLLLCGGLLLASWGVSCSTQPGRSLAVDGRLAMGEITSVNARTEQGTSHRGRPQSLPQLVAFANVGFKHPEGKFHARSIQVDYAMYERCRTGTAPTGTATLNPPQQVTVVYMPDDPSVFDLESNLMPATRAKWLGITQGVMMYAGIFCGVLMIFAGRRMWQQETRRENRSPLRAEKLKLLDK